MILLTADHRARLLANGRNPDQDHVPVEKLFNPVGIGTWLVTRMESDGDTLFGLADLGFPEYGSFSLSEIAALRLPFGMGIERDLLLHRPAGLGLGEGRLGRRRYQRGGGGSDDLTRPNDKTPAAFVSRRETTPHQHPSRHSGYAGW